MRRSHPTARAALVAIALGALLGACDGRSPIDATRPSLDVEAAAAGPDSGELVLYPSGAVATDDGGAPAGSAGAYLATLAAAPSIRIGVVQFADSIVLGSAADYAVKDRAGGVTLFTGSNGAVVVRLASVLVSNFRLQVMCSSVAAVNARRALAEAAGHVTFTNFNATVGCTRLFIGAFPPPPANTFAARRTFRNALIAAGLAANDSFWVVVSFGSTLFSVRQGAVIKHNVDPVVITSSDGLVTIGGARYRHRGEARTNGAGTMAGVNELPVEEYLYGVVPRELGPVQFPEREAQKAQAVAARTYALRGLGKRSADGYDLRATTDDQVYGGFAAEHPVSSQAVDETRGVVVTHGGALIDALFSSTSGGHTADSEESFSAVVPYLRGIVDSDRKQPPGLSPSKEMIRGSSDLRYLRQYRQHDFEADWAGFHRWSFEWTQAEMASILATSLGRPVTTVYEINELSRGPSGRVLALEYVTDAGRDTVRRDAIRASMRFINASGARQNLLSTLFFIEATDEKGREVHKHDYGTVVPAGFRAYGAGFGHGVGMAQTGAVGMAAEGYGYEAILKRYYTGVDLESRY